MVNQADLAVAASKAVVPNVLTAIIVQLCKEALDSRGVFTIALSGGSLPKFLSTIKDTFDAQGVDPKFDTWHVILADERCVPSTHDDSNLKALKDSFLAAVSIPDNQIYGINEEKIGATDAIATDYEVIVKDVLSKSGGQLDVAVLGFGPDGHTCSLFPDHALLKEDTKWVAPIDDSPKLPSSRVTLTFPVLNTKTRHVVFCGAGGSKSPILKAVFSQVSPDGDKEASSDGKFYKANLTEPAPYPSSMVFPNSEGVTNTLTWVVDNDAMEGVAISNL